MTNSTPADTVLLTQISDGADHLRLISDEEFSITLKLNILFFDKIALGSPDLLGNRRLYDLYRKERGAIERLFTPSQGGDAVLHPTLWDSNSGLTEVAERMANAHTIHSLPNNEYLLDHARFLDSLRPHFLYMSENLYRQKYFELLNGLMHKALNQTDVSLQQILPAKKATEDAIEYLDGCKNFSSFSCSAFFRFIDSKDFREDGLRLKHAGATIAHYAQSSVLDSRISVPDVVSPFIAILRSISPLSNLDDDIGEENIDTDFPIQALERLSLAQVLDLRDLDSLRKARRYLNEFRMNGGLQSSQVRAALDDAASKMIDFAYSRSSDQRHMVRMQLDRAKFLRMRVIYNLAFSSTPVAVAFFVQANPNIALLSLIQLASYAIKSSYDTWSDKIQGKNIAHPSWMDRGKEIIYEGREGRIRT